MTVVHSANRPPSIHDAPDVYFEAGYGSAAALMDGGDWMLLSDFDEQWQIPLIVRSVDDQYLDATSPYGYSGVYCSPSLSARDAISAWRRTMSALHDLRIVSIFLRHSPLVPQPQLPAEARKLLTGHPTVVMNTSSETEIWKSLRSRCRTAIRKAQGAGFSCQIAAATSADLRDGSDFRRLYQEAMKRTGASSKYNFGEDYFQMLRGGLGSRLQIGTVHNGDGDAVAASLVMRHGATFHYHLSGSTSEGGRSGANNLLIWSMANSGCADGVRRFHLGGGLTDGDSLLMFKRSFSRTELDFWTTGLKVDYKAYDALLMTRGSKLNDNSDYNQPDFFPAYRLP